MIEKELEEKVLLVERTLTQRTLAGFEILEDLEARPAIEKGLEIIDEELYYFQKAQDWEEVERLTIWRNIFNELFADLQKKYLELSPLFSACTSSRGI